MKATPRPWCALPSTRTVLLALLGCLCACGQKNTREANPIMAEMNLKSGEVITCGPPDQAFGTVAFATSCPDEATDFNLALALLHSFEYDEAEKVFARIIAKNPDCAMAYWGVAMSNFHPLWMPPTGPELQKGLRAVARAESLAPKSSREAGYIAAIAAFYRDWDRVDHRTRCVRFEQAMAKLAAGQPTDKEATVFYALALTAAADPADTTLGKQKRAGAMLQALYPGQPDHPGIVHYIIHAYDAPQLATLALPAARKYAALAPSSAHALHMPSHIFTRLGLWQECIGSNLASVASARCYAEAAGLKGHWDEELHGLDYLTYAYLQAGDNPRARQQWEYLKTIKEVSPVNFKVAYAYAAIPARYVLENGFWQQAAQLPLEPAGFPWQNYPWQAAIVHFTRLLGAVHLDQLPAARAELKTLHRLHAQLLGEKDAYKAGQVLVQLTAGRAWIAFKEGKKAEARRLMEEAASLEDRTEKHPVTPAEVLPARELLAHLLLQLHQPGPALAAYEASLRKHPNRFNALYGAGQAARQAGDFAKAATFYRALLANVPPTPSGRPELTAARQFLEGHPQREPAQQAQ
jgi:tetratricopeptide (TPR) repeat protein